MKKEDLMKAMNGIDEKDIEESEYKAAKTPRTPKIIPIKVGRLLVAGAGLVLIIGGLSEMGMFRTPSSKNEIAQTEIESASVSMEDKEDQQEMSGLANPMEEKNIDDQLAEWNASLHMPDGASDIQDFVIHGENDSDILERQFTLDGSRYTARVQPSDSFIDNSGMNYDWPPCKNVDIAGKNGEFYRYSGGDEEESAGLCLWFDSDNKLMYSLSMTGEENGVDHITEIANQL